MLHASAKAKGNDALCFFFLYKLLIDLNRGVSLVCAQVDSQNPKGKRKRKKENTHCIIVMCKKLQKRERGKYM